MKKEAKSLLDTGKIAQKIATFLIARNQILSYRSNVLLLCLLSTSTLLQKWIDINKNYIGKI